MRKHYTFSALEETTGLAIDIMMQITGMDRSKTIAYCIQKCYQDEYEKDEDYIKNLRAIVKMQKNLKGAAEDCNAIKKALQDFVDAHTEDNGEE